MNGEDLADKAGIKKENRFIFSDSYYANMPEVPEKPNFDVLGLPKKETPSSNSSVQQASSFDQIVHNDYTKSETEPSNHMFNFFSGSSSNDTGSFGNSDMAKNMSDKSDMPNPFMNQEAKDKVDAFNPFAGSSSGLNESSQVNDFEGKMESSVSTSPSTNLTNDSFVLPPKDSDSLKLDGVNPSSGFNNSLSSKEISSNDKEKFPTGPFDFSTESSNANEMDPSVFAPSNLSPLPSRETEEKEKSDSKMDSTINIFSNESVNDSVDFYKPEEPKNNDYFFTPGSSNGALSDIEKEKIEVPVAEPVSTKEVEKDTEDEDSVDFIERLKSQESSFESGIPSDDSTSSSQFAMPVDQMEDKKDFLWKPIEKTPIEEIKVPERKLEYDQNFMSSTPIEENRFIVNGDPSVEIRDTSRKETDKIPDFMSGTFQASDLNISTGVNQELEAELLKQREEEEAKKRQEALESSVYRNINQNKKNQKLVYKAGGKSYVREIEDKPKIELWPANQPPTSTLVPEPTPQVETPSVVNNQEPIDLKPIEEERKEEATDSQKKEEPKSIQELIESIVNVPGLSNIEVKLNPFENPGVKFGFQEKVDKKEIPEDQPTNVYDEKADNFDYDQNFENVEVVKSTLLEELIGKSQKEGKVSVLARYGEDFCARDYITNPAIGRAEEIKQLILILLTPEKSGILIGKPGIGKTSIVEGLAYQLQRNNVPEALKGFRIVSVKTPSLLGSLPTGETRLQTLVDELKGLDKVILFIDEIHMLIGATNESSMDFANMFKESLGRGTIKVIGATTTEEYERYILRDKAFVRRFQKIEVEEPSREHTIKILMGTLPKIEKTTGAKLKYSEFMQTEIMSFIVDITTEYKRIYGIGSRYPDICLTLLSQAFSQAVFANRTEVTIQDIRKAIENSKNIYPDVIRKELVNFDQKFKDLIREEELGQ